METEDIINGLKHIADDHECCEPILNEAIRLLTLSKPDHNWFQLRTHRFLINEVTGIWRFEGIPEFTIRVTFQDGSALTVAYESKGGRDIEWRILVKSTPQLTDGS